MLTNKEQILFDIPDNILGDVQVDVDDIALERSVLAQESDADKWKWVDSLPLARVREMQAEEEKKLRKKKLREERRAGKRKKPGAKGRRHWKSKEATRKRQAAKAWATRPFECVVNMDRYKYKKLDRAVWDKWAAPLWEQYNPSLLRVRFPSWAGKKEEPWSMYNILIYYKEELVLDGSSVQLYELSS